MKMLFSDPILIVVDGFDECDSVKEQGGFLGVISDRVQWDGIVFHFITTRRLETHIIVVKGEASCMSEVFGIV